MVKRSLAVMGLVAVLANCGGGGNGEGTDSPTTSIDRTSSTTTTTEPPSTTTTTVAMPREVAVLGLNGCRKLAVVDLDSGRLVKTITLMSGDVQPVVRPSYSRYAIKSVGGCAGDNFDGAYSRDFTSSLAIEERNEVDDIIYRYRWSGSAYSLQRVNPERNIAGDLQARPYNVITAAFRPGTDKIVWLQTAIQGDGYEIYEDGQRIAAYPRHTCDSNRRLRFTAEGSVHIIDYGASGSRWTYYVTPDGKCLEVKPDRPQLLSNRIKDGEQLPDAGSANVLRSPVSGRMAFCTQHGGETGLWLWDGQTSRRIFTPEPTTCSVTYVGALS